MNSFIITVDGISLYLDGTTYSVETSHPNYGRIYDAVRDEDFESIPNLVNTARAIDQYIGASDTLYIDVEAGVITYNGEVLRSYLVQRILKMMDEGFNIEPLTLYLAHLLTNPSKRAIDELHGFNEYGQMPITPDGCFIAFKRISGWYDTYTKTVFNKPAALMDAEDMGMLPYTTNLGVTVSIEDSLTTVSMARNRVDDNSERTCSEGLHFCSQEYLKSFSGDKIVVLKINPRDVVSIPVDYNNTKGRCSKYQVLDVLSDEEFRKSMGESSVFNTSVYGSGDDDADDADASWIQCCGDSDDGDDGEDCLGFGCGDDSPEVNGTYADGYGVGYGDGRYHKFDRSHRYHDSDFLDGYIAGNKDGRGHKKKMF